MKTITHIITHVLLPRAIICIGCLLSVYMSIQYFLDIDIGRGYALASFAFGIFIELFKYAATDYALSSSNSLSSRFVVGLIAAGLISVSLLASYTNLHSDGSRALDESVSEMPDVVALKDEKRDLRKTIAIMQSQSATDAASRYVAVRERAKDTYAEIDKKQARVRQIDAKIASIRDSARSDERERSIIYIVVAALLELGIATSIHMLSSHTQSEAPAGGGGGGTKIAEEKKIRQNRRVSNEKKAKASNLVIVKSNSELAHKVLSAARGGTPLAYASMRERVGCGQGAVAKAFKELLKSGDVVKRGRVYELAA